VTTRRNDSHSNRFNPLPLIEFGPIKYSLLVEGGGKATMEAFAMITEIVLFRLPDGMSRKDAMSKYQARVPLWQANPDLIHKAFLYDETSRRGGGVYLWKNIEAAKIAHGPAFQDGIQSIFGAKPEFQYFEAPIVIDNVAKQVVDNAA
jgi:hypothetical protein